MAVLYLGLHIAKEHLQMLIESVFLRKKLSLQARREWELYFSGEYDACLQMPIKSKLDCAYLEFKVRRLMDAAMHLSFDRKEPWQGHTIPLKNLLFPVFQ